MKTTLFPILSALALASCYTGNGIFTGSDADTDLVDGGGDAGPMDDDSTDPPQTTYDRITGVSSASPDTCCWRITGRTIAVSVLTPMLTASRLWPHH